LPSILTLGSSFCFLAIVFSCLFVVN